MKEIFSNNLKLLRKNKQLSQEQLAERLGVTTQAVSKWECSISYPDIEQLPVLADLLEVSIDRLLRADCPLSGSAISELPDDNVLRILQCKGRQLLQKNTYSPDIRIPLAMPDWETAIHETSLVKIEVEIWGNADIKGDILGYVDAGAGVNCGNVGGYVDAGWGVNCGNVGGYVDAGTDVNCDSICGNVEHCGGDIRCNKIEGDVHCSGTIYNKDSQK